MEKKKLDWKNLRAKRCPACGSALVFKQSGYECQYVPVPAGDPCTFFISHSKLDSLKETFRI